jgi:citrate lyase beta subunit
MTNEQALAAEQIREIADKHNLVVSAIWCANDIMEHYNNDHDEDKRDMTIDEAEDMLFHWEKQLKENAIQGGYSVIDMMLEFEDDE